MQSENHLRSRHACPKDGHPYEKHTKCFNETLRKAVRIVLPVFAAVAVATTGYTVHAWAAEVKENDLSLQRMRLLQATAPRKPLAEGPLLRFAFSDGPLVARADANAILLAANTPPVRQDAYGLFVDGKFVGAVYSREHLQDALLSILSDARDRANGADAVFMNQISIVPGKYDASAIVTDAAMALLLAGDREPPKTYFVQNGETLAAIAKKTNTPLEQLQKANPGNTLQTLHDGDEILLEPEKKRLTVQVKRTITETRLVPYPTQTVTSDQLYHDQTAVQRAGAPGELQTTYEVTEQNGQEVSRRTVRAVQSKAPVAQIVCQGTKVRPSAAGVATGYFLWPTPSLTQITSGYGARWGSFHYGLDLSGSNAMGQPINAADGGTVVTAGYDAGGYGNYLVIDHGNGFQSIYGHASKLLVSKGTKVAQGQLIALVGSTGHSTGAHCHFEVHQNGQKVNPTELITADVKKMKPYVGQAHPAPQVQAMVQAARISSQSSLTAYQQKPV